MPGHIVTPGASELIQSLRKEGTSYRECARILKERTGIGLSHVAIKRHCDSIEGKKRDQPQELRERAARRAAEAPPQAPPAEELPEREVLAEIPALEREIETLQRILAKDMPLRDRTAINAELRATFASLKKARDAEREELDGVDADDAWVLAKLKRFDAMEATDSGAATDDETDGLPQAPRTAAAR